MTVIFILNLIPANSIVLSIVAIENGLKYMKKYELKNF